MRKSTFAATRSGAAVGFLGLGALSCASVHSPPGAAPSSGYASPWQGINSIDPRTFEAPTGRNDYGAPKSTVTVPMVFPILGRGYGFSDEFGAPREGHRHLGQDLFAPKMTPLVAVFDGTIYLRSYAARPDGTSPSNTITLVGDNGYTAKYLHINNDTPGTNDGRGTAEYAFAPGLSAGQHVRAGEFIGWVGNSGNAETTPPHTHFELWAPDGRVTNATDSLRRAVRPVTALAEIPLPEWRPAAGETRWDGRVRGIDPARGVLTLDLLSITTPKGTVASTRPVPTDVRVAPTAAIRVDGTGPALRFGDIQPGDLVALRGKAPIGHQPSIARAGARIGGPSPEAREAEHALAAPPSRHRDIGQQVSDWWNGVKRRGHL